MIHNPRKKPRMYIGGRFEKLDQQEKPVKQQKDTHDCRQYGIKAGLDDRYLKCTRCGKFFLKTPPAKTKKARKGAEKPCQAQMFS